MIEYKKIDIKKEINLPLVSVVIPSYNSASTIGTCIESLKRQEYIRCEILIIDNCSSDDTSNIAQQLGANVFEYLGKRTSARNYGARKSLGKYLFHVDSDMELTPGVIKECVNKCETENVDALIIPELSIGEGYWARCKSLEKQLIIGIPGYESARFMRRESFDKIGGYDENLEVGEDNDIHFRIKDANFIISRVDAYIIHHEKKLTLKKIILKNIYYGKTMSNYVKKNKPHLRNQISVPHLYLKRWKILMTNLTLVPGIFIIMLFEFIFVGRYARLTKNT